MGPAGSDEYFTPLRSSEMEIKKELKKLGHFLLFIFTFPVVYLFTFLPPAGSMVIGKWFGRLAFFSDRRHRLVCLDNLKIAFPHYSAPERWRIARASFENLGRTVAEIPGLIRQSRKKMEHRVQLIGKEHYDKARQSGKGILILTAHIGNWELLALMHPLIGERLAFVARPLDNIYFDRWLTRLRLRSGNKIISKYGAILGVYRALRQGYDVGLLMDQRVSTGAGGLAVEFFFHQTGSSGALALLAARSGRPVVPIYMVRDGSGVMHKMIIEPEVPIIVTGNKESDLWINTQNIQKTLENIIERYPEQWFWMHRRWKKSPTVVTRYDNKQLPPKKNE